MKMYEMLFREKHGLRIVDYDSDLFADAYGNVKRIYEAENEDGGLQEYTTDEPGIEAVIVHNGVVVSSAKRDRKRPEKG